MGIPEGQFDGKVVCVGNGAPAVPPELVGLLFACCVVPHPTRKAQETSRAHARIASRVRGNTGVSNPRVIGPPYSPEHDTVILRSN